MPGELDTGTLEPGSADLRDTYQGRVVRDWMAHWLKDVKTDLGPGVRFFRDWAYTPPADPTDRAAALAAVQRAYAERGWGAGMAGFMALTSRQGEFTDDFEVPDPAQFGLPTEDDGTRSDPLLSGVSNAVTAYRPDVAAVQAQRRMFDPVGHYARPDVFSLHVDTRVKSPVVFDGPA